MRAKHEGKERRIGGTRAKWESRAKYLNDAHDDTHDDAHGDAFDGATDEKRGSC
jgi:hypothetical protein